MGVGRRFKSASASVRRRLHWRSQRRGSAAGTGSRRASVVHITVSPSAHTCESVNPDENFAKMPSCSSSAHRLSPTRSSRTAVTRSCPTTPEPVDTATTTRRTAVHHRSLGEQCAVMARGLLRHWSSKTPTAVQSEDGLRRARSETRGATTTSLKMHSSVLRSSSVLAASNESQADMAGGASARGLITMNDAMVHTEQAANFVVAQRHGTTFHLKAASEVDRQRWVTALELAKHRAIKAQEAEEEAEMRYAIDDQFDPEKAKNDMQQSLHVMNAKVQDLLTCQDLLGKHGTQLHKALTELEHQLVAGGNGDSTAHARLKLINERATLFRITADAMIQACNEFVALTSNHNRRWHMTLQYEHQQRMQLQHTLEQLARQHSLLERAAMHAVMPAPDAAGGGQMPQQREQVVAVRLPSHPYSDSEEDATAIFHDAEETLQALNMYSTEEDEMTEAEKHENDGGLRARTPSQVSSVAVGDMPMSETESRLAMRSEQSEQRQHRQLTDDYMKAKIVVTSHQRSASVETRPQRTGGDHLLTSAAIVDSTSSLAHRTRRRTIPPKPNHGLSLWSIMRNCIGKELSKIPMPVNFNEPLSFLQRITEDLEYAKMLLDRAAQKTDSTEQMCYVAAFSVSMYSTTSSMRATKPFNPLLGETYECDRWDDLGWRSLAEQVSHHPPVAAQHCEGRAGWVLYQEFSITSKFRGKYLSVIPTGNTHLKFADGNHYTWRRVTTTVHNIIVGKLWIDHHGEMEISNHATGDRCSMKFIPYSYFSKEVPRKVTAVVTDSNERVRWMLQGTWDSHIDCMQVVNAPAGPSPAVVETLTAKRIWEKNPPLPGADKMYHLTRLAVELNEPEDGVAPTDSRRRPDQRLMEEGQWDESNAEKVRLEEKQRQARRAKEAEAEQQGRAYDEYEPVWFRRDVDEIDGTVFHMYTGKYWQAKVSRQWAADEVADIFA